MDLINPKLLPELQKVRDRSSISSRNTSTGALVYETYVLFQSLDGEIDHEQIREAIITENRLSKNSYEMRRKAWLAINNRYLTVAPQWVGRALVQSANQGNQSPEFLSLAYLYFALRDRLTFLFVTRFIWPQWQQGSTHITHRDAMRFIYGLADEEASVRAWHEATKKKIASTLLSSLRDFGLLRGTQTRHIQRPPVALETVYHLLCILQAEGKSGREIVNAPDWRLFLWSETDIAQALTLLD